MRFSNICRRAAARRALLVLFSSFFGTRFVVFCIFLLASSCRDSPGSTNGPPCSTVRHCLTQPKQALHTNPSTRPTPLPPPQHHTEHAISAHGGKARAPRKNAPTDNDPPRSHQHTAGARAPTSQHPQTHSEHEGRTPWRETHTGRSAWGAHECHQGSAH